MLKTAIRKNAKTYMMLIAMLAIWFLFSWMTDGSYLTPRNLSNLFRQTAITGILAMGMVFVIITGEIDLSVGSLMGLLGGVAAVMDVWLGMPLYVTIIVTLLCGFLLGLWNGFWVAFRHVPSFIVTLAGMLAFRGVLVGMSKGTTIAPVSSGLTQLGQSYLPVGIGYSVAVAVLALMVVSAVRGRKSRVEYGLPVPTVAKEVRKLTLFGVVILFATFLMNSYRGIPTPVLIMMTLIGVLTYVANKTTFGRRLYAIGGNIEAARLSGVNVERMKLFTYAMNGTLVAVAGLILTSRLGAASPSMGNMAELDAIAACVIGGTSMAGGVGTVIGTLVGALVMASLDNGMSMMDIATFWQYIVKGMILLLAVWMDVSSKKQA
ncbi:sugar ABC transporter permease [Sansalvadorimonas sp. 2012CJ34-2]|uniref:Xylose transport system permease protein XylH n=1 Tax=Parendozoicomonas callyspongiae TaxID=2942213 RepID=A0ABT0PKK7_9GAMM|nr:sugar ABC transporter permease [Sansalvadorimonas sp. 2012CJ34-2]MCL6271893.1 sugar ABC transporter permease [Sansalvadorimonas sp. 2012CJ34-2]